MSEIPVLSIDVFEAYVQTYPPTGLLAPIFDAYVVFQGAVEGETLSAFTDVNGHAEVPAPVARRARTAWIFRPLPPRQTN